MRRQRGHVGKTIRGATASRVRGFLPVGGLALANPASGPGRPRSPRSR
ncbi:MAG TPA: hypothetical protein VGG16_05620 [Streptosporangiaceae bacterium]